MSKFSDLNGVNGFQINGISNSDYSGHSVSDAGDLNGDGYDDLIIGAHYADPSGNDRAGESYVIFGAAGGFDPSLDLSTLDGANGFALSGTAPLSESGYSVSGAGDINGDGYDDLIIGAWQGDPNGKTNAGAAYVVFGKAEGYAPKVALADLNGSTGFAINGLDGFDYLGISVSSAGDLNGDGLDDLVLGAYQADPNKTGAAGESYVIFGSNAGYPSSFDLSSLDGGNGFVINGEAYIDFSGNAVSGAGDINGDGYDDLIIGAYGADPAGAENAGKAYVVFGQKDGFDSSLDLARLDGSNGFALTGEAAGDYAGRSVSNAGDVNGDGLDDLIIGAYWADVDGNAKAGKAYVVFGKAGGFDATLALGSLDGSDGFALTGLSANNNTGTSVSSAGDVNGDGLDDILVSAPNAQAYRGDTYLIYGKAGGFDASLSLADLDGGNGLRLTGVDHYDYSGISASGAGDMNGDGYSDVIIGANVADPNGLSAAGESYVLFGGPDGLLMPPSSGPSIDPLPENLRIPELVPFELTLSASDPNGNDTISINADLIRPNGTLANPKWYQFTDNGDGTGTINWRVPERYKDVTYTVVVTADDGENPAVVDSFLIDVFDTNAPVFADLEDAMVEERSNISFDVMASDRDGDDTISLSATLLRPNGRLAKPERYEFTDLGDGTGHFTWDTPSRSEDGAYTLRITAEDGLNRPVHREMTITVLEIDDMILM